MRKALAAALAGASLAAVLAAGAGAGVTATCSASQLRGKLNGASGAAGTLMLSLTLRNAGGACSLKGYAGLRLATHVEPLPTKVVHGGLAPLNGKPRIVLLAHNGKATVLVAYSDVPGPYEGPCPASTAILLRPPGSKQWVSIAVRARACNGGTLRESAVLAGVHRAP